MGDVPVSDWKEKRKKEKKRGGGEGTHKGTLKQRSCIRVSQNSSYKNDYAGVRSIIPEF
jgi:hypothetical protein